jgi:hypothetical protein
MSTPIVRKEPEPGYWWYVRYTDGGAVLGWFDYQAASWHAAPGTRGGAHDGRRAIARHPGPATCSGRACWAELVTGAG